MTNIIMNGNNEPYLYSNSYIIHDLITGTTLLFHFDVSSGETIINEYGEDWWALPVPGYNVNTGYSDTIYKFGKSLGYTQLYIIPTYNFDFNFGFGDFTYDWWWRPNGNGSKYGAPVSNTGNYPGIVLPMIEVHSTGVLDFGIRYGDNKRAFGYVNQDIQTWGHFAVVRKNLILTCYHNGIKVNNFDNWATPIDFIYDNFYYDGSHPHGFVIGNSVSQTDNSNIDEFRMTNYACWSSNFTPPTEPYI